MAMTSHPPIIKTIREGLLSALTDFVSDAGFITELDFVMEFVYELGSVPKRQSVSFGGEPEVPFDERHLDHSCEVDGRLFKS